jgi:cysteine synthase A
VIASPRPHGLSSICNVLAAIKTAKVLGLGPTTRSITVATDGGALYASERALRRPIAERLRRRVRPPRPQRRRPSTSTVPTSRTRSSSTTVGRNRIFNLGYFTWVEQQGTPFELFEARRNQEFWRTCASTCPCGTP